MMLNLAVISEPAYCVVLNFLGKSQSAQDSQLFLHRAFAWFADASFDKFYLFPRVDGRLRRGRHCPLVPGDRTGDCARDTLPPPGAARGSPAPSLLLLLAMNTALADVVAGVHLRLPLSTETRGNHVINVGIISIHLGTYCWGSFHLPGYLSFGTEPYCPSSSRG